MARRSAPRRRISTATATTIVATTRMKATALTAGVTPWRTLLAMKMAKVCSAPIAK